MTIRTILPSDIPTLKARAESSGFPYPDLADTEATLVILDASGGIVTACAAVRMIELYLYPMEGSPLVKKNALELMHRDMAALLREKKYNECNVQLPPSIAKKFGRRLQRSFGWVQNTWDNWFIRF